MTEEQKIEGRIRTLPPCKGCEERFIACHSNCPKDRRGEFGYSAWRSELEKANQARNEYNFKAAIFSRIT